MTIIKVVCAWCGKYIGEKDGEGQEGISHGMCEECFDKWDREHPEPQVKDKQEVRHESD